MEDKYAKFILEQEEQEVEWLANRGINKAKKTSEVSILKQQLESKDRQCALLKEQPRGQEVFCKVTTMISNLIRCSYMRGFSICEIY